MMRASPRTLTGLCLLALTPALGLAAEGPQAQTPAPLPAALPQDQQLPSLIFDRDHGQSLDLELRNNVKLRFLIPQQARDDVFAATSGIWKPLESVALSAGYGVAEQAAGVQLLGCGEQISCVRAINQQAATVETYSLGASWRMNNSLSLKMDYLNRQADARARVATAPWVAARFGSLGHRSALSLGDAEALDISLTCDIDAGGWGDLELGLQVSRIVNQGIEFRGHQSDVPYTSAAFGLGWQRGAFRGDVTSRYLDVISQPDDAIGWTSLDVNFAWRMPWNASVSVGARNVLNTPAPATNNLSVSEMENFFGRVPYVRYQQDL